ncbi:hypothetical protein niasHT_035449 [Heterodera trifolii]|uniref:Uncharacterized protein n=1 Tax=Heterodera trifolii TaxID=157864 RepID=A0ABD2IIR4_9BILA
MPKNGTNKHPSPSPPPLTLASSVFFPPCPSAPPVRPHLCVGKGSANSGFKVEHNRSRNFPPPRPSVTSPCICILLIHASHPPVHRWKEVDELNEGGTAQQQKNGEGKRENEGRGSHEGRTKGGREGRKRTMTCRPRKLREATEGRTDGKEREGMVELDG